jgi:hypothetical protein
MAATAPDDSTQVLEAIALARQIISRQVSLIEGVRRINDLAWDLDDDGVDPRYDVFRQFESKVLNVPPSSARAHWNPTALANVDAQAAILEAEHRLGVEAACRSLIESYGHEL